MACIRTNLRYAGRDAVLADRGNTDHEIEKCTGRAPITNAFPAAGQRDRTVLYFMRKVREEYMEARRVAQSLKLRKLPWSGRRDSNPRPRAWEAPTLPTELRPLRGGGIVAYPATRRFLAAYMVDVPRPQAHRFQRVIPPRADRLLSKYPRPTASMPDVGLKPLSAPPNETLSNRHLAAFVFLP